MGRLLNLFSGKYRQRDCKAFPDALQLYEALYKEQSDAIRCVYARISGTVAKIARPYGLRDQDLEELIGDCIALLLLKIRTGHYVFQGYDPASFAIEIAKNKLRHFKKSNLVEWSEHVVQATDPDLASAASTEVLEHLLVQLPENCQRLIRLKYLEERRDKDIVAEKLTQYSTVDALKNHRAQCMKKLSALASEWKINQNK